MLTAIRPSKVVAMSVVIALMVAMGILAPLFGKARSDGEGRDYVAVSQADQKLIVRSMLLHELHGSGLCESAEVYVRCPIFFDHASALAIPFDPIAYPASLDPYETRSAADLFDRGSTPVPWPLKQLLTQQAMVKTFNDDPAVPGVIFVGDPRDLPALGEMKSCAEVEGARLVRISKAAMQESTGIAIALVKKTSCNGDNDTRVVEFKREGSTWSVVADRFDGP